MNTSDLSNPCISVREEFWKEVPNDTEEFSIHLDVTIHNARTVIFRSHTVKGKFFLRIVSFEFVGEREIIFSPEQLKTAAICNDLLGVCVRNMFAELYDDICADWRKVKNVPFSSH